MSSVSRCRSEGAVHRGRTQFARAMHTEVFVHGYDDPLQFVASMDAQQLDESLGVGDVSRAWLVWSSAAETALADADVARR